jgi:putative ABC transport system permease protein
MFGAGMRMSAHGGYGLFDRHARDLPGAEALTIFTNGQAADSYVNGRKIGLTLKRTDADFWRVYDFTFRQGRPFSARDVEGAAPVAVISESARDRLLGHDAAVGVTIDVGGQRFRVMGVVANVSQIRALPFADVWVPVTTAPSPIDRQSVMGGYQAVVLARSQADLDSIRSEFLRRIDRVEKPAGVDRIVAPFETQFEGFARQMMSDESTESKASTLQGVMVAAGVLLALLPAVNLVNLNVSRILERASEIGVRKAFGASSRALVAQFVVENILLTLVGAVAAFALSAAVLYAINSSGWIAHAQLELNGRVLLAGVGIALLFGIMSGVYPAWRMSRLQPVHALKGQAR